MTMKNFAQITLALILPSLFVGCAMPTKNHKRVVYVLKRQELSSQPVPESKLVSRPASRPTNQPRVTRDIFTGEIITEAQKEEIRRKEREFLEASKDLGRALKDLWDDLTGP